MRGPRLGTERCRGAGNSCEDQRKRRCCSGTGAPLPTAAEVLQKFEKAIGGREVWSGFTTRVMKGIYQPEDLSGFAAVEIITKAPNK